MSSARTWSILGVMLAAACSEAAERDAGAAEMPARDAGRDGSSGSRDASALHDAAAAHDARAAGDAGDTAFQWMEIAGSVCRNGSVAGLHVSRSPTSRDLLLYLEGGGACYDMQTCAVNPDSPWQLPPALGLFARDEPLNPVADWNIVYVPYCSGDHYVGDAEDVEVPGVPGVQQFKGRPNMELFLARIVADFPDVERVLLAGTSAGGIGTVMSYRLVQEAFGSTPVTVIDDAGPLFSKEHAAPCLAEMRRALWGVDRSVLADCGEHCPDDAQWAYDYALYNIEAIPRPSGLITSIDDAILRSFLGIGSNDGKDDCQGALNATPLDSASFSAGLLDLRATLRERAPRFGTFYPQGPVHGWLVLPGLYTQTAGQDGVRMIDWVRAILDGEPAMHVGP